MEVTYETEGEKKGQTRVKKGGQEGERRRQMKSEGKNKGGMGKSQMGPRGFLWRSLWPRDLVTGSCHCVIIFTQWSWQGVNLSGSNSLDTLGITATSEFRQGVKLTIMFS